MPKIVTRSCLLIHSYNYDFIGFVVFIPATVFLFQKWWRRQHVLPLGHERKAPPWHSLQCIGSKDICKLIMKLPAHRAGLPGEELSFILCPLTPYPALAGRGTFRPTFLRGGPMHPSLPSSRKAGLRAGRRRAEGELIDDSLVRLQVERFFYVLRW